MSYDHCAAVPCNHSSMQTAEAHIKAAVQVSQPPRPQTLDRRCWNIDPRPLTLVPRCRTTDAGP
eukprot:368912-Rhodomonas_salina.1